MIVVCEDGTEIECESIEAAEYGVIMFERGGQNESKGFIPTKNLKYVLPEDVYSNL